MPLSKITNESLAANTVDSDKIAANAIGTSEIANDAVTGAEIENNPTIAGNLTVSGTSALTGDATLSRAETNGTVRLNLSNTGVNGSSEYSEIKLNSTAGGTQTSVIQHRNNYGLNIGTTTDHAVYFLQNNSTAMAIDTDGYITKPLQPSISVDGDQNSGGYIEAPSNVTYHTITEYSTSPANFYNQGIVYNNINGRFTVPKAGKYLVGVSLYAYSNNKFMRVRVEVNGTRRTSFTNDFRTSAGDLGQDVSISGTCLLNLSASDYITFRLYVGNTSGSRYGRWEEHHGAFIHLLS